MEEPNLHTRTYTGKKALIFYNLEGANRIGEEYPLKKEINIYDELEYRDRIIQELARMAMEHCPMLNCREELKDIPLIYWREEDFTNEEEERIQEVLEKKESEFNGLLTELIIEQIPEFKIDKENGDYLCFHEQYVPSSEDKRNNIFIKITVDKYNDEKKLMETELKDVIHLYLGCEFMANTQDDDMPIDYVGKLLRIDKTDKECVVTIGEYEYYVYSDVLDEDDIKPILRYISDITESEQEDWNKISTPIGEMAIESAMQIHWAKRLNFYRSIGLDCDGLLESGQAINKLTLNQ